MVKQKVNIMLGVIAGVLMLAARDGRKEQTLPATQASRVLPAETPPSTPPRKPDRKATIAANVGAGVGAGASTTEKRAAAAATAETPTTQEKRQRGDEPTFGQALERAEAHMARIARLLDRVPSDQSKAGTSAASRPVGTGMSSD